MKHKKRHLSHQEFKQLVQALPLRWRDYVVVMAMAGLSIGEIYLLHSDDVDLTTTRLVVRGRSERIVPISAHVASILRRRARGREYVFEPWHNVGRQLGEACRAAKVPLISTDDLRRSFVNWLHEAGVSFEVVASLVGRGGSTFVVDAYSVGIVEMRDAVSRLSLVVEGESHGEA